MKESFVLYTRYAKHIEKLDMEQRGVLFTAIMNHATGDDVPEMDCITDMIYGIIIEDIEECDRKWRETKEARSKAGKASAQKRAEANKAEQVSTKSNKTEQNQHCSTSPTVYVNVNENVNVSKENTKKKNEADFEALWELYPKKQGKRDAKRHYLAAVKEGATFDEVKAGIEAYKTYIDKTGTDYKYVKMGSSFFNQRAWEGNWTVHKSEQKTTEPPKYKVFEKEEYEREDFKAEEMPEEIRERLNGMFGS